MRFDFIKNASGPKRILLYTLPASTLILAICLISLLFVQLFGNNAGTGPSDDSGDVPGNDSGGITYSLIPVASSDVYSKGTLLVVNTHTKIQVYPSDDALVTIYGENKTDSYKVNLASFRLRREALTALNAMMDVYLLETADDSTTVTSAYRTEAEQAALTSSKVQAGYSEHHLALSVRLRRNKNSAVSNLPSDHWIYGNGHKYGFIQRYPVGKEDVTFDEQDYVDCFRFVGIPHATYIYENGLCLEEYVALLKSYTYEGTHLTVTADGVSYEIYYVPAENLADENAVTQLPVPEGAEYSYSGNNTDGFIVTVTVN
ncbi:MAG: D-alanyl-D-alanine carboxypeptidase family protein [Clostridia bacterium]|nr:D-alanyl-D-alanine carboxypeptidase family protein [Clostridia bacterium]